MSFFVPRDSQQRTDLKAWPRWVLCRTRRQARVTAGLYGAALFVVASVAVQGLGSSRILVELALVLGVFLWSLAQLNYVAKAEQRLSESVRRTIDSLPGGADGS